MKYSLLLIAILLSLGLNAQRFTDGERKLILSGDTSAMLRVIPLSEPAGQKALVSISTDIGFDDPLLPLLKSRMLKAVLDSSRRGVGIAAPQVGINRNLIWVQRFDKQNQPFEFYINPKIVWRSSVLCIGPEGDLSFEGRGDVVRHFSVMVSYTDMQGKQHLEVLEDFSAVIFQHETDHLSGTLFTDRIKDQKGKKYVPFSPVRAKNLLTEEKAE
ncbi:peptide deformylase [Niabella insulamsoli]|uniref:peptide deformylase n=1 Tax=Niabella insulamsoli TaxID=3144874 RepID=UPI0031FD3AD9